MKTLLFFITVVFVQIGFAQREANVWHFGDGAGVDFNSCEPIAINSAMVSSEGCTSIADGLGELQFYTEGSTIWNRNHEIMSNGDGLLGHRSATQAAMIIKRPGNFNEYYVFTVDTQDFSNGLMYSVVDMDAEGGLGEVISKNIPLITPIVEKIHATRHANGEDVWVSVHGFDNNNFYSFLITSSGVSTIPVISSIGSTISGDDVATIGAMKFSPNGRKLAICNYEDGVSLFDFDNNEGLFTNPKTVTSRLYSYGVEFSTSNNILYITTVHEDIDNMLLQYDLTATEIEDSETVILDLSDTGEIGSLQLGPDYKLYVSINNRNALSVINNPNNLGLNCNFVEDAITLGNAKAKRGLPLLLPPFLHNKMIVGEACLGEETFFSLEETYNNIIWDFGDPASGANNISTESEPTHIFSAPGIYTVTTSIPSSCGSEATITEQIEIFGVEFIPSVQLIQCDDNSDGVSYFNLNEANSKLSVNFINEEFTFYNSQDDAVNGVNLIPIESSYKYVVDNSDTVWARVENSAGCFKIVELSLIVSSNTIFDDFQSHDFIQCDDNENDGITTFNFSSVETDIVALFPNQTIEIEYYRNLEDALAETNSIINIDTYENIGYPNSQNIYVRVEDAIKNDCLGIGTPINLTVIEQPQFELVSEVEICLSEFSNVTLEALNPNDNYSYEWTDSKGNIIGANISTTVELSDVYTLVATSGDGCKSFPKEVIVTFFEKLEITNEMINITGSSDNYTINIDYSQLGNGVYEYALNDEFASYQAEPYFENVTAGDHTIFVREKNSCEPSSLIISIIGFPKFFTPNNDSQNDTWNVEGINKYSSRSRVFIYDRYGKLIKQLNPWSNGWDGTFNGEMVATSDYWFTAELIDFEGKKTTLTGHFSLIR